MLRVKELKQMLAMCNDEDTISFQYWGPEMEIEAGDTFRDIDAKDIELEDKSLTIIFS